MDRYNDFVENSKPNARLDRKEGTIIIKEVIKLLKMRYLRAHRINSISNRKVYSSSWAAFAHKQNKLVQVQSNVSCEKIIEIFMLKLVLLYPTC